MQKKKFNKKTLWINTGIGLISSSVLIPFVLNTTNHTKQLSSHLFNEVNEITDKDKTTNLYSINDQIEFISKQIDSIFNNNALKRSYAFSTKTNTTPLLKHNVKKYSNQKVFENLLTTQKNLNNTTLNEILKVKYDVLDALYLTKNKNINWNLLLNDYNTVSKIIKHRHQIKRDNSHLWFNVVQDASVKDKKIDYTKFNLLERLNKIKNTNIDKLFEEYAWITLNIPFLIDHKLYGIKNTLRDQEEFTKLFNEYDANYTNFKTNPSLREDFARKLADAVWYKMENHNFFNDNLKLVHRDNSVKWGWYKSFIKLINDQFNTSSISVGNFTYQLSSEFVVAYLRQNLTNWSINDSGIKTNIYEKITSSNSLSKDVKDDFVKFKQTFSTFMSYDIENINFYTPNSSSIANLWNWFSTNQIEEMKYNYYRKGYESLKFALFLDTFYFSHKTQFDLSGYKSNMKMYHNYQGYEKSDDPNSKIDAIDRFLVSKLYTDQKIKDNDTNKDHQKYKDYINVSDEYLYVENSPSKLHKDGKKNIEVSPNNFYLAYQILGDLLFVEKDADITEYIPPTPDGSTTTTRSASHNSGSVDTSNGTSPSSETRTVETNSSKDENKEKPLKYNEFKFKKVVNINENLETKKIEIKHAGFLVDFVSKKYNPNAVYGILFKDFYDELPKKFIEHSNDYNNKNWSIIAKLINDNVWLSNLKYIPTNIISQNTGSTNITINQNDFYHWVQKTQDEIDDPNNYNFSLDVEHLNLSLQDYLDLGLDTNENLKISLKEFRDLVNHTDTRIFGNDTFSGFNYTNESLFNLNEVRIMLQSVFANAEQLQNENKKVIDELYLPLIYPLFLKQLNVFIQNDINTSILNEGSYYKKVKQQNYNELLYSIQSLVPLYMIKNATLSQGAKEKLDAIWKEIAISKGFTAAIDLAITVVSTALTFGAALGASAGVRASIAGAKAAAKVALKNASKILTKQTLKLASKNLIKSATKPLIKPLITQFLKGGVKRYFAIGLKKASTKLQSIAKGVKIATNGIILARDIAKTAKTINFVTKKQTPPNVITSNFVNNNEYINPTLSEAEAFAADLFLGEGMSAIIEKKPYKDMANLMNSLASFDFEFSTNEFKRILQLIQFQNQYNDAYELFEYVRSLFSVDEHVLMFAPDGSVKKYINKPNKLVEDFANAGDDKTTFINTIKPHLISVEEWLEKALVSDSQSQLSYTFNDTTLETFKEIFKDVNDDDFKNLSQTTNIVPILKKLNPQLNDPTTSDDAIQKIGILVEMINYQQMQYTSQLNVADNNVDTTLLQQSMWYKKPLADAISVSVIINQLMKENNLTKQVVYNDDGSINQSSTFQKNQELLLKHLYKKLNLSIDPKLIDQMSYDDMMKTQIHSIDFIATAMRRINNVDKLSTIINEGDNVSLNSVLANIFSEDEIGAIEKIVPAKITNKPIKSVWAGWKFWETIANVFNAQNLNNDFFKKDSKSISNYIELFRINTTPQLINDNETLSSDINKPIYTPITNNNNEYTLSMKYTNGANLIQSVDGVNINQSKTKYYVASFSVNDENLLILNSTKNLKIVEDVSTLSENEMWIYQVEVNSQTIANDVYITKQLTFNNDLKTLLTNGLEVVNNKMFLDQFSVDVINTQPQNLKQQLIDSTLAKLNQINNDINYLNLFLFDETQKHQFLKQKYPNIVFVNNHAIIPVDDIFKFLNLKQILVKTQPLTNPLSFNKVFSNLEVLEDGYKIDVSHKEYNDLNAIIDEYANKEDVLGVKYNLIPLKLYKSGSNSIWKQYEYEDNLLVEPNSIIDIYLKPKQGSYEKSAHLQLKIIDLYTNYFTQNNHLDISVPLNDVGKIYSQSHFNSDLLNKNFNTTSLKNLNYNQIQQVKNNEDLYFNSYEVLFDYNKKNDIGNAKNYLNGFENLYAGIINNPYYILKNPVDAKNGFMTHYLYNDFELKKLVVLVPNAKSIILNDGVYKIKDVNQKILVNNLEINQNNSIVSLNFENTTTDADGNQTKSPILLYEVVKVENNKEISSIMVYTPEDDFDNNDINIITNSFKNYNHFYNDPLYKKINAINYKLPINEKIDVTQDYVIAKIKQINNQTFYNNEIYRIFYTYIDQIKQLRKQNQVYELNKSSLDATKLEKQYYELKSNTMMFEFFMVWFKQSNYYDLDLKKFKDLFTTINNLLSNSTINYQTFYSLLMNTFNTTNTLAPKLSYPTQTTDANEPDKNKNYKNFIKDFESYLIDNNATFFNNLNKHLEVDANRDVSYSKNMISLINLSTDPVVNKLKDVFVYLLNKTSDADIESTVSSYQNDESIFWLSQHHQGANADVLNQKYKTALENKYNRILNLENDARITLTPTSASDYAPNFTHDPNKEYIYIDASNVLNKSTLSQEDFDKYKLLNTIFAMQTTDKNFNVFTKSQPLYYDYVSQSIHINKSNGIYYDDFKDTNNATKITTNISIETLIQLYNQISSIKANEKYINIKHFEKLLKEYVLHNDTFNENLNFFDDFNANINRWLTKNFDQINLLKLSVNTTINKQNEYDFLINQNKAKIQQLIKIINQRINSNEVVKLIHNLYDIKDFDLFTNEVYNSETVNKSINTDDDVINKLKSYDAIRELNVYHTNLNHYNAHYLVDYINNQPYQNFKSLLNDLSIDILDFNNELLPDNTPIYTRASLYKNIVNVRINEFNLNLDLNNKTGSFNYALASNDNLNDTYQVIFKNNGWLYTSSVNEIFNLDLVSNYKQYLNNENKQEYYSIKGFSVSDNDLLNLFNISLEYSFKNKLDNNKKVEVYWNYELKNNILTLQPIPVDPLNINQDFNNLKYEINLNTKSIKKINGDLNHFKVYNIKPQEIYLIPSHNVALKLDNYKNLINNQPIEVLEDTTIFDSLGINYTLNFKNYINVNNFKYDTNLIYISDDAIIFEVILKYNDQQKIFKFKTNNIIDNYTIEKFKQLNDYDQSITNLEQLIEFNDFQHYKMIETNEKQQQKTLILNVIKTILTENPYIVKSILKNNEPLISDENKNNLDDASNEILKQIFSNNIQEQNYREILRNKNYNDMYKTLLDAIKFIPTKQELIILKSEEDSIQKQSLLKKYQVNNFYQKLYGHNKPFFSSKNITISFLDKKKVSNQPNFKTNFNTPLSKYNTYDNSIKYVAYDGINDSFYTTNTKTTIDLNQLSNQQIQNLESVLNEINAYATYSYENKDFKIQKTKYADVIFNFEVFNSISKIKYGLSSKDILNQHILEVWKSQPTNKMFVRDLSGVHPITNLNNASTLIPNLEVNFNTNLQDTYQTTLTYNNNENNPYTKLYENIKLQLDTYNDVEINKTPNKKKSSDETNSSTLILLTTLGVLGLIGLIGYFLFRLIKLKK